MDFNLGTSNSRLKNELINDFNTLDIFKTKYRASPVGKSNPIVMPSENYRSSSALVESNLKLPKISSNLDFNQGLDYAPMLERNSKTRLNPYLNPGLKKSILRNEPPDNTKLLTQFLNNYHSQPELHSNREDLLKLRISRMKNRNKKLRKKIERANDIKATKQARNLALQTQMYGKYPGLPSSQSMPFLQQMMFAQQQQMALQMRNLDRQRQIHEGIMQSQMNQAQKYNQPPKQQAQPKSETESEESEESEESSESERQPSPKKSKEKSKHSHHKHKSHHKQKEQRQRQPSYDSEGKLTSFITIL